MTTYISDFIINLIIILVTAILALIAGALIPSIRHWLFYKINRYKFEYDSDFKDCRWDIQWENQHLMIDVEKVHADHLEKVKVVLNSIEPGHFIDVMSVSQDFIIPKKSYVHIKLDSIVKTKSINGIDEYMIYLIIRRRKW